MLWKIALNSKISVIFLNKFKELKIVCDDLETDIGKVKISSIGGDRYIFIDTYIKYKCLRFLLILFNRGHNGLKSIVKQLNSNDFEKIKIGIGRPSSKDPEVVANYCLSNIPRGK